MELTLAKDKVTPGTIRFREVAPDAPEDYRPLVIYISKNVVKDTLDNAETITMTIEKAS